MFGSRSCALSAVIEKVRETEDCSAYTIFAQWSRSAHKQKPPAGLQHALPAALDNYKVMESR
jgi:hypothetical protein